MQAARRRPGFYFPSRLGRRAEAGPRRVLPRVRPPAFGRVLGQALRNTMCFLETRIDDAQ